LYVLIRFNYQNNTLLKIISSFHIRYISITYLQSLSISVQVLLPPKRKKIILGNLDRLNRYSGESTVVLALSILVPVGAFAHRRRRHRRCRCHPCLATINREMVQLSVRDPDRSLITFRRYSDASHSADNRMYYIDVTSNF